jgi:hypothetical protein
MAVSNRNTIGQWPAPQTHATVEDELDQYLF